MTCATTTLPEAFRGRHQLEPNERFPFSCHPGVPCFNQCCSDVTILLTPADALRLARTLGMGTREFLDRHTLMPATSEVGLPVVMLRMEEAGPHRCPFVGEQGCTVYDARPWACRMYPVGMGVPPARAGVEPEPVYVLFEDDFCHGRNEQRTWTVEEWRRDQRVDEQEALDAGFRSVMAHPWFIGGTRRLDRRQIEMFVMAAYDLDTFRTFVLESSFLKRFVIEPEHEQRLATDDAALLDLAFRWLRFALFGEPTLVVRTAPAGEGRTK